MNENEKNIGYLKGSLGSIRAQTIGGKARNIIAEPELIKERFVRGGKDALKGLVLGVAPGALLGAGVGAALSKGRSLVTARKMMALGAGFGSAFGGVAGVDVGLAHGLAKANKDFLATKGITHKGLYFPRGYHFTPEAKKLYRVEDVVKESGYMDKTSGKTLDAFKTLAKPAAVLAGIAGSGYGGYKIGQGSGARKASNVMAQQFQQYNEQENSAIAQEFFNRGVRASKELPKEAMDIYFAAYNDELEKIGAPKWLAATGKALKKGGTEAKKAIVKYLGRPAKYMGESYAAGARVPKYLIQAMQGMPSGGYNAMAASKKALPAVLATATGLTGAGFGVNKLMKKEAGAKEVKQAIAKGLKTGLSKAKDLANKAVAGTKESFQVGFGKGPGSVRSAMVTKKDLKSGVKVLAPKDIPADDAVRRQYNRNLQAGKLVDPKYMGNAVKKAIPAYAITAGGLGTAGYGGYKGVQAIQGSGKERKM